MQAESYCYIPSGPAQKWRKRGRDQFSSDVSGLLNLREREDRFAPATSAGMMSSIKCTWPDGRKDKHTGFRSAGEIDLLIIFLVNCIS